MKTTIGTTTEDSREAIRQVVTETLLQVISDLNSAEAKDSSGACIKEDSNEDEERLQQKLECLRLAAQRRKGDVLTKAKEYFAWLNTKD